MRLKNKMIQICKLFEATVLYLHMYVHIKLVRNILLKENTRKITNKYFVKTVKVKSPTKCHTQIYSNRNAYNSLYVMW